MCGICGAISIDRGDALELVQRMTPTMVHRGPDDEGYLDAGGLALGMRRLSIIDPARGHQPIFNEDGTVAVILNGEIYNFRELKDHLWNRGHTFSTRADSEVIAHAYEEWGADCVHHLQGMFAFAVFDQRVASGGPEGTLFLARDRLGIKPLYYWQERLDESEMSEESRKEIARERRGRVDLDLLLAEIEAEYVHNIPRQQNQDRTLYRIRHPQFIFASELRTILSSGAVERRLSRSALQSFLLFGSVSEPETLIDDVYSLPPGHTLTLRLGAQRPSLPQCYWNIGHSALQSEAPHPNRQEAQSEVRALLEASVRRHLIADVPVGVFLSSGIDSTALAALASREVAGVHTFTVAFSESAFNEADIARRTAERFGTNHSELMLTGDEMLTRVDEAVAALDQPSMDGLNTYFVSWAATQAGMKVALSGLGGDEVFGGYSTFRHTPQLQKIAALGGRIPDGLRSAMAAAVTGVGEGIAPGDAARKIAALWNEPDALPHPYFFNRALFTPGQVGELQRNHGNGMHESEWWQWLSNSAAQARQLDDFTGISCMEAQSYLVNTLLRDTDVMSMAHSLEVRVPFLDHELVEFVTRLPMGIKYRKGLPKSLLIGGLEDVLPAEVVNQEKRGFTFPWGAWLKGPLRKRVERGFKDFAPALAEVLNEKEVRGVWKSFLKGHTSWSRPWSLYVLNEWVKEKG